MYSALLCCSNSVIFFHPIFQSTVKHCWVSKSAYHIAILRPLSFAFHNFDFLNFLFFLCHFLCINLKLNRYTGAFKSNLNILDKKEIVWIEVKLQKIFENDRWFMIDMPYHVWWVNCVCDLVWHSKIHWIQSAKINFVHSIYNYVSSGFR